MIWCTFVCTFSQYGENWMHLCWNSEVFSSTEELCAPSLWHTPAQQFLMPLKGAERHFSMKNPQTTGLKYCISTFFFFWSSREDIWKKDNFTAQPFSSLLTGFDFTPFMLWPLLWFACSMECLFYRNMQVSQSTPIADSIDWNCLGSGKFQQWAWANPWANFFHSVFIVCRQVPNIWILVHQQETVTRALTFHTHLWFLNRK